MTNQRTQQRPAAPAQRPAQPAPQRSGTDLIVEELHLLRMEVGELLSFLRQQATANEPVLYCPPDEHCTGGFRLYKHAPEYWKNDGKDNDRLYHQLPEELQYRYAGEGPFNGTLVKNHNVWRSRALTMGGDAQPEDAPPIEDEDLPF